MKKILLALTAVAMLSGGGIVSANDTATPLVVENGNYIGIESHQFLRTTRATALLASPGGPAIQNLPAGIPVRVLSGNGAFVFVEITTPFLRTGWIALAAL